jgi:RNA polymerase sigma factor (sigma-70 family)
MPDPTPPTPLSDHDLLRDYVTTGAQDAFAELVRRHVDLVYGAARRQVGRDAHLAEDVTQAVFLMLATKARAGAIGPNVVLAGWLYNATRYAAANATKIEARRRHHERKGSLMTRPTHDVDGAPIAPADPAADADAPWTNIAPLLDGALAKLAAADRDAVLLKYIQGKSHRDVGHAMGVSEEAARKRVHRALARLRTLLARRGVAVPAAALATLLATNATEAAPATLLTSSASVVAPPAAAAALAKSTLTTVAVVKAKVAAALVAASFLVAGGAGYTAHLLARPAAPRPTAQAPAPRPQAPVVAVADQIPAAPAAAKPIEGTIVRADGQPMVDVEVYLATPKNGINLYTRRQGARQVQVTEPDGKFSFPRPKDDLWKVVAMTPEGIAEIAAEDLAKSSLVVLQPWGRIEGTLLAATTPIPGATVSVGEWGWGNDPLSTIVTSQTTVKTDKDGHFTLPRVPPGAPLLSHQAMTGTLKSSKWECVAVAPGQTVTVALGAAGRPVTGKVAVPPGYEKQIPLKSDKLHYWDIGARVLKPLDLLGGVNPQMGGMPMPPGWHKMSPREQSLYRRDWDRSPAGVAYRRYMFADEIGLADGGAFRFDALRPGRYALSVRSLISVPDQNMLEDVAGGELEFTVPAPPGGAKASDEPVDLGTTPLAPVPRIAPGDQAPPFQATSLDHKPVKLDDYKGKFLVLQVLWPHLLDPDAQAALRKAYDAFAKDPQFAMLTVHIRLPGTPPPVDSKASWTQSTGAQLPESPPEKPSLLNPATWLNGKPAATPAGGIPPGYLRGPATIFLIGPDGTVITKILKASDVETAVAKAMLERK